LAIPRTAFWVETDFCSSYTSSIQQAIFVANMEEMLGERREILRYETFGDAEAALES